MCRKPLYLSVNPRLLDGAEGTRCDPVGLLAAHWRVRLAHPAMGQSSYPIVLSRKG